MRNTTSSSYNMASMVSQQGDLLYPPSSHHINSLFCHPSDATLPIIAHHILTLYALGASPELIQTHYDRNKTYQRQAQPLDKATLEELHDYDKFHGYLGNERYYYDYLEYFRGEVDKKGYTEVINEYCLKGDERTDDMLIRLHAGFLHPMIHLGFGVEFKQPAIIAEALAQAAVHDSWIEPFMLDAEKAAASSGKGKSMVGLMDEVRADKKLSSAAKVGRFKQNPGWHSGPCS